MLCFCGFALHVFKLLLYFVLKCFHCFLVLADLIEHNRIGSDPLLGLGYTKECGYVSRRPAGPVGALGVSACPRQLSVLLAHEALETSWVCEATNVRA